MDVLTGTAIGAAVLGLAGWARAKYNATPKAAEKAYEKAVANLYSIKDTAIDNHEATQDAIVALAKTAARHAHVISKVNDRLADPQVGG